jgi:hypothetical protein
MLAYNCRSGPLAFTNTAKLHMGYDGWYNKEKQVGRAFMGMCGSVCHHSDCIADSSSTVLKQGQETVKVCVWWGGGWMADTTRRSRWGMQ